ncbi:MAG: hypothetical protein ACE5FR_14535, partial [Rhodospirillales bacterium]
SGIVVTSNYSLNRPGAQPLATRRQRAYLAHLIKRMGKRRYIRTKQQLGIVGGPLQVSRGEASRLIAALIEELRDEG